MNHLAVTDFTEEGKLVIKATCPICTGVRVLEVDQAGFNMWTRGILIQNALPMLTDDQRELLITGIDPECWKKTFPPEEEEEVTQ